MHEKYIAPIVCAILGGLILMLLSSYLPPDRARRELPGSNPATPAIVTVPVPIPPPPTKPTEPRRRPLLPWRNPGDTDTPPLDP